MMIMNQRVVGLIGISSRMANWNADFTGRPKTTSDGTIFGSDKALKFSMKRMWEDAGHKVLYIRSYKDDDGTLRPRSLEERFEFITGIPVKEQSEKTDNKAKGVPAEVLLKNLFECVDVMNFGATFAVAGQNLSLTGIIQIGQGFNLYNDTNVEVQDILSPFRNPKDKNGKEKDASSIGKKITVNEAHYLYPFTVNPHHYDEYFKSVEPDSIQGYTTEAYELFKKAALQSVTALETNSKSGCENEFALFVTFKEGKKTYLPNLDFYVTVEKSGQKIIYNLEEVGKVLLAVKEDIESVEVFFNPYRVDVRFEYPEIRFSNILNQERLNLTQQA